MIIGKTKVVDWIRYNKTPYWRIKRSESEQHNVVNAGDEENIALEESVTRLNQAFGIMSPGNYFIEAWTTKGQTKNWNRDHFQILPGNEDYVGSAQLQQAFQQQQPTVNVAEEIQKALNNYKTEIELNDLRRKVSELERENKELQSGIESSISRIWNKAEPYVGMMLNNNAPASVAAIGATEMSEAEHKRLEVAWSRWKESDPVTMIEKIADLSLKDPATYSSAKTFLTGK